MFESISDELFRFVYVLYLHESPFSKFTCVIDAGYPLVLGRMDFCLLFGVLLTCDFDDEIEDRTIVLSDFHDEVGDIPASHPTTIVRDSEIKSLILHIADYFCHLFELLLDRVLPFTICDDMADMGFDGGLYFFGRREVDISCRTESLIGSHDRQ